MAARRKPASSVQAGGALMFLGSLIYLLVYFMWYGAGYSMGPWLIPTAFFAPFVIATALVSTISIFFMSFGFMKGKPMPEKSMMLWKIVMLEAMAFVIITGGTGLFSWVVLALVLTYLGGAASTM